MENSSDWQAILSFWFEGSVDDLHKKRWFVRSGTELQKALDNTIFERFGKSFAAAQREELNDWKSQKQSFIALIILLDQFSRHIARLNNVTPHLTQQQNDTLASSLSREFQSQYNLHDLTVPEFVFVQMPLRHNNPSSSQLSDLLTDINAQIKLHTSHSDLLQKFKQTTAKRLEATTTISTLNSVATDNDILEHFEFQKPNAAECVVKEKLYQSVLAYVEDRHPSSAPPALVVSLSGGVDSMVIAYLLTQLTALHSKFRSTKVVAVHIDYGNRDESALESDFVKRWCNSHRIEFEVRRITEVRRGVNVKRDDYERIAKEIRYQTYADVLNTYAGSCGICFGHHEGDVQENVISNFMKGLSLLELNGMTSTSVRDNGIEICRPLLAHNKAEIFDFAHEYGVPYFKDTTPLWSIRGKLRTRLLPLLSEIYGDGFLRNLSSLGQESNECHALVHRHILNPCLESLENNELAIILPCASYQHHGVFFWKEVMRRIFHDVLGSSMVRDRPMQQFVSRLEKGSSSSSSGQWLSLKKEHRAFLTSDLTLIIFKQGVFTSMEKQKKLVAGECFNVNKWVVKTEVVSEVTEDIRWNILDVARNKGVSYFLPECAVENGEYYCISTENRGRALRQIEKALTDKMPLVAIYSNGSSKRTERPKSFLKVSLTYQ